MSDSVSHTKKRKHWQCRSFTITHDRIDGQTNSHWIIWNSFTRVSQKQQNLNDNHTDDHHHHHYFRHQHTHTVNCLQKELCFCWFEALFLLLLLLVLSNKHMRKWNRIKSMLTTINNNNNTKHTAKLIQNKATTFFPWFS